MEVNVASRKDLADAIQSYNDNDNITFISGAKVLKDLGLLAKNTQNIKKVCRNGSLYDLILYLCSRK